MLGRARAPVFLHHPLIRDDSGNKLSKSAGDTGVRELRAAGVDAAGVIGRAAFLVGLVDRPRPVPAHEVHLHFLRSDPTAGTRLRVPN
jgi:hypothetical protein